MSDLLEEGLAAFDRQLGIEPGTDETATAATEAAEEAVTTEAETTTDDRPRNPDGTFAKTETEEAPAQEADPKFESYLQRFGADPAGFEQLAPEVQKAIRAGYEADGMTGRQGQELGELKKLLEQVQTQTAPQPAEPQQYDEAALADYLMENPAQIMPTIQNAYQQGDMTAVYLGIAALEDTGAPRDRVVAQGLRTEIAAREVAARMAPQLARSEQVGLKTTLDDAVAGVAASYPDFVQYGETVMQAVTDDPELARGLVEGTLDDAKRVLTNLYKIAAFDAAGRDGSTLAQATATAAAEQQAEADQAKKEGFVATGTTRVESEQQQTDPLLAAFDKVAAERYYARD